MTKLKVEIWEPVVGYEGIYEVSNFGQVRSVTRVLSNGNHWRGKVRSLHLNSYGYPSVNLCLDGVCKTRNVHRLVLEAFKGIREGMQCCHNDGDPTNNNLENLRWGTPSENAMDRVSHGTHNRGARHGNTDLCELDVWLIRNCEVTNRALAEFFEVAESTIHNIKNRITWKYC